MKVSQYGVGVLIALAALSIAAATSSAAPAAGTRTAILQSYLEAARAADAAFAGFDAKAGEAFFRTKHKGGKPKTPACMTCHTRNPRNTGKTRAGKTIAPMAVSRTAKRFTDPKKVEKWFRRNCKSVLGRVCTPREKGNFITFMATQ